MPISNAKIIFVYDEDLSRKNRQFTVRLQKAVPVGEKWESQAPFKIYYAKDLREAAAVAADKAVFKEALESEMSFRKMEARVSSHEAEFTFLRIPSALLFSFITQCQKKKILVNRNNFCTNFKIYKNVLPELLVEDNRFDLLFMGSSISESQYVIRSKPVCVVYPNRIIQVRQDIAYDFIKQIPVQEDLSENRRESLLLEYSRMPDKISILTRRQREEKYPSLPGHDEKKPVLNFDESLKKAQLLFFYDGFPVVDADPRTVILDPGSDIGIHRDVQSENRYREILLANGFFLRPKDRFNWFLSRRSALSVIPVLEAAGFSVRVKNRKITPDTNLKWRITSDRNYIQAVVSVVLGSREENPESLFRAFQSNRPVYVKSDGTYGIISDEIRNLLSRLSHHGIFSGPSIRFKRWDFAIVSSAFDKAAAVNSDPSFEELRRFARKPEGDTRYDLPPELKSVLRPYQTAGFNWLKRLHDLGFSGILADDMGLGKTVQVLSLLKSLKMEGRLKNPVLLAVPKTLLFNWRLEIEKFTPDLTFYTYAGPERSREKIETDRPDIVLTSYGLVRTETDFFRTLPLDYFILDEANAIKNPEALLTQAVKTISCPNRLAVTGTPVENSPMDLWSLFDFLMPGFLSDWKTFKSRTADRKGLSELHTKTRPFILRRLKKEVLAELPPKTEISYFCEFTEDQKQAYDQALVSARDDLSRIPSGNAVSILPLLLKLRQIACHPELALKGEQSHTSGKTEAVFHLAEEIFSEGYKILIFSQFTSHLKLVRKVFRQTDMNTFYLDGQTRDRKEVVQRFKAFKGPCAFFISLKAGGTGLNLPEANYVFLLDPWWNPAVENQAMDRSHRMGQKLPVTVYRFITRGSIEEKVMVLKAVKKQIGEILIRESAPDESPIDEQALRNLIWSD